MRERLIELIKRKQEGGWRYIHDEYTTDVFNFELADHLLANGVIVPPVTVGQTVWFIRDYRHDAIIETTVEKIVVKHGGLYIKLACNAMYETSCKSIGKTVFLTKAEAEQALEDMRKE